MKKLTEAQLQVVKGGTIDRCYLAGLTSVINPLIGVAVAGGPTAYWNCIWA